MSDSVRSGLTATPWRIFSTVPIGTNRSIPNSMAVTVDPVAEPYVGLPRRRDHASSEIRMEATVMAKKFVPNKPREMNSVRRATAASAPARRVRRAGVRVSHYAAIESSVGVGLRV